MRNFVAIRAETINDKLCYIGTSTERFCYAQTGEITTRQAIDFLFSLHALARRKDYKSPVFIWYCAEIEVQRLLRDLSKTKKDILFPSPETTRKRKALRVLIREYDKLKKGKLIKQRLSDLRERLHKLEYVYWNGYRLHLRETKSLTIYRSSLNKSITIYDICHFFNKDPLPEVSRRFLGYSLPALDRGTANVLPLFDTEATRAEAIKLTACYVEAECETLVALGCKLNDYLECAGLMLKRWYGASAAVSTLLTKWKAKQEFKRITKDNTPRKLRDAIERGFVGGRIETLTLGMVENVYAYDLNSAFAYATTLLPNLKTGWKYTREYDPREVFALWFVEYDLPREAYLGILPHRTSNSSVLFKRAGRGWYFAPEAAELARTFPDSFAVKEGYYVPYKPIAFAERIRELYAHRQSLIAKEGKGKGEKIFKSLLQHFYGKFCQTVGDAPFYCLPWAGWITSFVRAQMLEIIRGQEQNVLYFHTDAVHSRVPLVAAHVSDSLGDWRCNYYPRAFYLDVGVHCFYDEEKRIIKSATRGFESIDFDDAIRQLNREDSFGRVTLKREFFAGHQYAQAFPLRGEYLKTINENLTLKPKETRKRKFALSSFDWSMASVNSRIVDYDDGEMSYPRREPDYSKRIYMMLDVLNARR